MTDDKPLSVPRDIDLRLDTSPITAVDALGNPTAPAPFPPTHRRTPASWHPASTRTLSHAQDPPWVPTVR